MTGSDRSDITSGFRLGMPIWNRLICDWDQKTNKNNATYL